MNILYELAGLVEDHRPCDEKYSEMLLGECGFYDEVVALLKEAQSLEGAGYHVCSVNGD